MKILIDANSLRKPQKTGISYYTEGVIKTLSQRPNITIDLMYFNFLKRKRVNIPYFGKSIQSRAIFLFPAEILKPLARILHIFLPIELFITKKYDWHIFPDFTSIPSLRGTKNMIIIHDLCFIDHPEYVDSKHTVYLKNTIPTSIERATKIACVSKFTESRVLALFPKAKGKTFVTYVPPVIEKTLQPLSKHLVSLGINDDSYFLCVGTLEPRKNIRFLVDAYVALPPHVKEKISLVLAGGIGWKMADDITYIQTYVDNGERIVITNYVSDAERQQLYEHARGFVMPSHYEGFGMPVLEAMVYGLPCAVNDIEVFRELCGESVTYFREIDELTQILIKYAESKQVIDYSQVIDQYSWQNVGDLVLHAIKD